MRARVGDLAIAKFDPYDGDIEMGRRWHRTVCIVIGTYVFGNPGKLHREYRILYWDQSCNRTQTIIDELPASRLVRARPKDDDWDGTLLSLTLDNVEPNTE